MKLSGLRVCLRVLFSCKASPKTTGAGEGSRRAAPRVWALQTHVPKPSSGPPPAPLPPCPLREQPLSDNSLPQSASCICKLLGRATTAEVCYASLFSLFFSFFHIREETCFLTCPKNNTVPRNQIAKDAASMYIRQAQSRTYLRAHKSWFPRDPIITLIK